MRAALIKDDKVINIAKFKHGAELPIGWIISDKAAIDDTDNGDGTFSKPVKPEPEPLTINEQIVELETSVTKRNLHGAILGDAFAIAKIQSVEDQIAVLRTEL